MDKQFKYLFIQEQYEKGGYICNFNLDHEGNIESMEVDKPDGNLLEIVRL